MAFITILLSIFFLFTQPVFADESIVKITNFSSNTLPEWVEINNLTDNTINLNNWMIRDDNNSSTDDLTLSGCLSPHSYQTFYHNSNWLNNGGDVIYLYNNDNQLIDKLTYTEGKIENYPKSDSTCVPISTPTFIPSPTHTPKPTSTLKPTSTPKPTKTPTPTKTPSPTKTPTIVPTHTLIPTHALLPTYTPVPNKIIKQENKQEYSEENILGATNWVTSEPTPTPTPQTEQQPSSSKNILPIIFISIGGLLLIMPLITPTLFKWLKKQL